MQSSVKGNAINVEVLFNPGSRLLKCGAILPLTFI